MINRASVREEIMKAPKKRKSKKKQVLHKQKVYDPRSKAGKSIYDEIYDPKSLPIDPFGRSPLTRGVEDKIQFFKNLGVVKTARKGGRIKDGNDLVASLYKRSSKV